MYKRVQIISLEWAIFVEWLGLVKDGPQAKITAIQIDKRQPFFFDKLNGRFSAVRGGFIVLDEWN